MRRGSLGSTVREGIIHPLKGQARRSAIAISSRLPDVSPNPTRPASIYCVYRTRNATSLRSSLDGLPPRVTVNLHRLEDESLGADVLSDVAISFGAGWRMPLLQRLIDQKPPAEAADIVIVDDDVRIASGDLARFIGLAQAASLDVAQPAHAPGSIFTWRVTRQLPFSIVRLSRFVEVGPVVLFSPAAQGRFLPFPGAARMGWGLDVQWATSRSGLRFGVVDAVPMVHLAPVAVDYSMPQEEEQLDAARIAGGIGSLPELDVSLGPVWRSFQKEPPWASSR